jgi:pimeloyl-ACP methyl ester carboxylesterase
MPEIFTPFLKSQMKVTPFKVNISQADLEDLKLRIKMTRWPGEIKDSSWSMGTNLAYLKELCEYWADNYSWRKTEREINTYPNYIAEVDGYMIHFLHIKGKGKKSMPLIISHGWPGSFLEMMKMVPLLTNNKDFSFDLVIPSILGFGFSEKVDHPGCNSVLIADLWHKLMTGLGYDRYGAQGGDVGSSISSWLTMRNPDHVIGLHLNCISGSYKPYLKPGEALSPEVIEYQLKLADWFSREGAYISIQSSKPQTVSYGMNDSPAGLCSWLVEKFHSWSDNNGNLQSVISKEELLGNISLYWLTQTLPSSIRLYQENSKAPLAFNQEDFIKTPVAFAHFPKELPTPPRSYIEKGYNIQRWTEMPRGGHFAAMEQPGLLSADLISFFSQLG